MKIVFKYLKSFSVALLLAIALLFVQAASDLNLPNYMSEIVNVGIQQNGIKNGAPDAISEDGMKLVKTFMSDEEKKLVTDNYKLVASSNDKYKDIYKKASGNIYVKNKDINEDISNQLDTDFGIASWTFINVVKELEKQNPEARSGRVEDNIKDVNLQEIYMMQPAFNMIDQKIIDNAHKKASSMDDLMLKQSSITFAKAFYTELGVDLTSMQTNYIFKIGALMLGIALIGGAATIAVNFFSSRIATGVARNLRRDAFNKIEQFSNVEYDKISTSSLITRCTNDIMQIQTLLTMGIRMICYAPIIGIGGVIMALNRASSMSWLIALAVIVTLGLILIIVAVAMPKFKIIQKLVDKLNLVSREELSGLMVIRAFGTQSYEEERFDQVNNDLTRLNLFVNRIIVLMQPIMMLVMNGLIVLIVWVGAHQISQSNMQVGDMMAFIQYATQVVMAFVMISVMFIMVPRAAVSAQRIQEVLDMNISIIDPKEPREFNENKRGLVEFNDVHFKYEGAQEDAIAGISFTAKPNETTAIIGSTGSGKTTIANLLMRFYDVTDGSIMVDGVDIREVKQHDLHQKIGYVPQKGVLLSGTIESNLKYGNKNITDDEMKLAANIAQATDFIEKNEEEYQADIAQGGKNVSGGQKQRLSIARAIAIKPEILFFDDSFSALDFKTDSTLRKAINDNIKDTTIIVVAQRVGTIRNAEKIIVLDQGKIVGQGKHDELLKNCPEYYEIASSQLAKEEL